MKKSVSIMIALLIGITHIYAENRELANGLSFSGDWIGDAIVINDNSTQYDIYMTPDPNNAYATWGTSGDLDTVSGTLSSTHVKIISTGPAKGRITYYYNQAGCGQMSASMDVYKHFNSNTTPYNIEISGPDCILEGDTVVYSIKPILTKYLTQGIGVDEYIWNIADTTPGHKKPFVDRLIYNAGDGSSVTFIAGEVSGNDTIKVQVGLANADNLIVKPLGKAAPKPIVNPICVPFGESGLQVSVAEAIPGVIYSWSCSDDLWGFKPQNGSSVTLKPGTKSSPEITVTAFYEGGEACSASKTTIKVKRSWPDRARILTDSIYPFKFRTEYEFYVSDSVPGGGLVWTPPTGWKVTYDNGTAVTMLPDTAERIKLHDSLSVEALNSCATTGVDKRKYDVYVKPAKVKTISGMTCLKVGDTCKLKITEWEEGPKAQQYYWYVGDSLIENYDTDSLIWKVTANKAYISVIPKGVQYKPNQYYNGDSTRISITYEPIAPTAIIGLDNRCVAYNMPDELTLSLDGTKENQSYGWDIPSALHPIYADSLHTAVTITTDGQVNSYPIKVWGKGIGNCKTSRDTITADVTINAINAHIVYIDTIINFMGYNIPMKGYRVVGTGTPSAYDWYFYDNEQPADGLSAYNIDNPDVANDYANVGDIKDSNYTIICIATYVTGCKTLLQYGKYMDLSNISLSRTTSNNIRRRNIQHNNQIQLFPNPGYDKIHIELAEKIEEQVEMMIIDAQGHIITPALNYITGSSYDISRLPKGQYFVCIRKGTKRYVEPFIKQ